MPFTNPTTTLPGAAITGPITNNQFLTYNGTPALGTIAIAISPSAGVDSYGNHFPAGITIFDGTTGTIVDSIASGGGNTGDIVAYVPGAGYVRMTGGKVMWGLTDVNNGNLRPDGSSILTNTSAAAPASALASQMVLTSPTGQGDALKVYVQSGAAGTQTGSSQTPQLVILDSAGTSAADILMSGTLIPTDLTGNPYTVQTTPAYGTGWSGSTTFNGITGCAPLQFWRDGNDEVNMTGCFKSAATAPSDPVFILPGALGNLWPKTQWFIPCLRNVAGALTPGMIRVSNNGHVDVLSGTGSGVGSLASSEWVVSGSYPLGNRP